MREYIAIHINDLPLANLARISGVTVRTLRRIKNISGYSYTDTTATKIYNVLKTRNKILGR